MPPCLVCSRCQSRYLLDDPRWRCDCCHYLDIEYPEPLDPGRELADQPGIWRYAAALPIQDARAVVSLGEGRTPLLEIPFAGRRIWVKQDHLCPTGSYKDRGAAVLVSHLKELGIRRVVEDSSGNAGAAIAAYCARAGIACEIYVPEHTSAGKLAQIEYYGAVLHRIPGDRSETTRAVMQAAADTYYASHTWNPFFFQGTKTFAYEVYEQLDGQAPGTLVLPVGNGTLLLGAYFGFKDLLAAGIITRLPRLIGVQAQNCAPLAAAWTGRPFSPPPQDTLAEGIAIANPVRGEQILAAIRESGGQILTVSEDQIRAALLEFCRMGFFIEPTAAAALAAIRELPSVPSVREPIVSAFTGHGLKATDKLLHLEGRDRE